jgi:DegV family protein with EDD domain
MSQEPVTRKVAVVTDTCCDLPSDVLEEYDIDVVPLLVHFGTEEYDDGELSPELFWEKARGPHHPRTSQPPVGRFEGAFERLISSGKEVLCTTVTSMHSGTFNAARVAAQRFGQAVQVFDSRSLSVGLGVQAIAAAAAARAGKSLEEILVLLEDLRARTRVVIVLDTLENLRRGGRADAFIAVAERMARALNIKVLVNVEEGQIKLMGAARSFRGSLKRLLSTVEQLGPLEYLGVAHTRSIERANQVADRLAELTGFARERILVRETGAVLSTHAGQGVIAVMAIPQAGRT